MLEESVTKELKHQLREMDPQTELYLRYYKGQNGGQLSAFEGARRNQVGGSIGGILSGLFRRLWPIAARGASTFLNETLAARDSGKGWGDAAKSAVSPTFSNVLENAAKSVSQQGTGRRRRKRKGHAVRHRHRHATPPACQEGGRRRRKGYKRQASSTHQRHSRHCKRIKFHNL